MDNETKIFVIYVGVAGIRSEDIPTYVQKITKKISPQTFDGEIIVIPTQSYDTKIECINPKYITDMDLINKNTHMMKELINNLNSQIEQLKGN